MRRFHRSFLAGFLFVLPIDSALAEPSLRIAPVDGVTDAWRSVPDDIEMPLGSTVQLEFSWGLNSADLNADGRVDLLDYATLSLCFSAPGGRRPSACDAGSYRAADLDADGDVDIDDANDFKRAMRNPQQYAVQSVTWFGAHQISRTASHTRAELVLSEPGDRVVRVEAVMTDPLAQRTIHLSREITIHVLDASPAEFPADWTPQSTPATRSHGVEPIIRVSVNAFNPEGKNLGVLLPGDQVLFELTVTVNNSGTPTGGVIEGNRGLATLIYDVVSNEAKAKDQDLLGMIDAFSGFNTAGDPSTLAFRFYNDTSSSTAVNYGGGWGFDRAGLPGGGDLTTNPGQIIAAGITAPLTWVADSHPNFAGLQPRARQGVGIGSYTFPADDPLLHGRLGGLGADFSNLNALPGDPGNVHGDGSWLFQTGRVDTTGWVKQTYNFSVTPTAGAVYDGSIDYTNDRDTGFRVEVPTNDMAGSTFRFTLYNGDCNDNGVLDDQDILNGTSDDCNANGLPDDCEPDCNGNDVADECDIAAAASQDCNANGVPDECDPLDDCNANGIQDICDTAAGTSLDCQQDEIPDECQFTESDCNANGIPDDCDPDCNLNGIPDECEPAAAIQEAELMASDGAPEDFFGTPAISGARLVVGAGSDDDNGENSGSAYVFIRNGTNWSQQAKLLPADGAAGDRFGDSVTISGNTIVVGARWDDGANGSGSAYVFVRTTTGWSQQAKLLPSDGAGGDSFGFDLAISGNTIVVGAERDDDNGDRSGSAYVFEKPPLGWSDMTETAKLLPSDGAESDLFGRSVAISNDTVVVGSDKHDDNGSDSGTAYVFEKSPLGWSDMTQTAKLLPSDGAPDDFFGQSVAISGDRIVIGSVFDDDQTDNSGSAYVFEKPAFGWTDMTENAKLLASDGARLDYFGWSIAISGDRVLVGAVYDDDLGSRSGSAYLFVRSAAGWVEHSKILPCDGARDDAFGTSVAISPDRAVIRAGGHDHHAINAGSAYVFKLPPLVLSLDIKPGDCPNAFNRNSHGVLPASLLGTASFDTADVDLASVQLSRADGVGGTVAPNQGPPGPQTTIDDLATPFDGESCDCHTLTADGFTDLSLKFRTDDLVAALELDSLASGALVELVVSGTLLDGSEFVASDCIRLVPPGTGPGMLTVNSNLPQAWIAITPLDSQLDGGGFGQFDRTWPQSTVVTFAAEEFYQGQRFVGWKFNGQFASRQITADITVIDQPQTIDALFRRAGDITGDNAINLFDFAAFAVCFGKTWGAAPSACSNEAFASSDLDRNGVIDLRDFAIFALHFGT